MALSKETKETLKKDFEAGKIPITEIAKKHGVSRSAMGSLEKREKWSRKNRKKRAKPKPKKKPKKGRPEKYNPDHNKMITALAMVGFTDEQISDFIGINRDTFYTWKKKHIEFSDALLAGRAKATTKVVVSLFQRATGYSHPEEKIFCQDGRVIRAETKKHYPPEYKCLALWLKNKEPELWKDKQEVEGSMEMKLGKITEEDVEFTERILKGITKK